MSRAIGLSACVRSSKFTPHRLVCRV